MKRYLLGIMGGTIDADAYDTRKGRYPARAVFSTALAQGSPAAEVLRDIFRVKARSVLLEARVICFKDSKDLGEQDVQRLFTLVDGQTHFNRIIITLGTDRMHAVAEELRAMRPRLFAPVVFTGAIWPVLNGARSDGPDNLRLAAFGRSGLGANIYIAMHDVLAPARFVYKDVARKRFYDRRKTPPAP